MKNKVLVILPIMATVFCAIMCITLPQSVVVGIDVGLNVCAMGSPWLIMVYPLLALIVCGLYLVAIKTKKLEQKTYNYNITLGFVLMLIYICVIKLELASQNFMMGEFTNLPICGILCFPVGMIVLLVSQKANSSFSKLFPNKEQEQKFSTLFKQISIIFGLLFICLGIVDICLVIHNISLYITIGVVISFVLIIASIICIQKQKK